MTWLTGPASANIQWVADTNHGVWNSGWKAAEMAGLGPTLLCGAVVMNLWYAPWNDGSFGEKMCLGFDEYRRVLSPDTCPVFISEFGQLLLEHGMEDRIGDDDVEKELWTSVAEAMIWNSPLPKDRALQMVSAL